MKKSKLKNELKTLRRRVRKKTKLVQQRPTLTVIAGGRIGKKSRLLANAAVRNKRSLDEDRKRKLDALFKPYVPPPGVLPPNVKPIAMDSAMTASAIAWAQSNIGAYWTEGLTFMGYPELANLTVRPEYRVISQVIATECTRKWISFQSTADQKDADQKEQAEDETPEQMLVELQEHKQAKADEQEELEATQREDRLERMTGKDDKSERIKELNEELERLNVRDVFYKLIELDGWMGRSHLYLDTGCTDRTDELMTDIGDGADDVTKLKFKKGTLERIAIVEPMWTYPQSYNAADPLKPDWYNPSQWFVMGKQLHASRLLTFVGRPVPDILKPAYAFGGLSLSQICKPYVDNWTQTRQSVNDIIHAFSVMVLSTDMSSVMQAGGSGSSVVMPADDSDLFTRLDIFNMLRDNRGVFAIDKESEDFKNVSAPLASLDSLQAQAQEHIASVSRIPLVKLLGISPHGLNASSEGELKAFYDTISSFQETVVRPILTRVVNFAMRNLWGEVDEEITFKFEDLEALDEKEEAEVRKIEAETDAILINDCNALHPEEIRRRVATDPRTPYEDIDIADVPEKPIEDVGGELPMGAMGNDPDDDSEPKEEIK